MATEAEERSVEVLIIGAGLTGLYAAHVYDQLSPGTELVILDNKRSIGGVWASECCYPGLKTQNPVGTYEYSKFPMHLDKYGLQPGQHIPGTTMHRYLVDYAAHHDLVKYIRLSTQVVEIEKLDDGRWRVHTSSNGPTTPNADGEATMEPDDNSSVSRECYYTCAKIISCVGLSSTPNPVSIRGMETFGAPILSASDLTARSAELVSDPHIRTVAVLGGSKTAYDSVATLAAAGKKVHWIIRKSGMGPLWMTTGRINVFSRLLPWFRSIDPASLTAIRFFGWFSPCVWGDADGFGWVRWCLNRTALGRWFMHRLWEGVKEKIVDVNGYRKSPELKGLEPNEGIFWTGRVGVLNYKTDIHSVIRSGQVTVIREDVSHLSAGGTIVLADEASTTLQTDALIAITGWSIHSPIVFSPPSLEARLGIPTTRLTPTQAARWAKLDARADAEIARRFPYLAIHKPAREMPIPAYGASPFRLYRAVAPPDLTAEGDNSIVFLKMLGTTANALLTEVQTLWAWAYLEGKLTGLPEGQKSVDDEKCEDDDNEDEIRWQAALMSRFGRHRCPCGFGAFHPEMNYDGIPYVDLLLGDLGLRKWRKRSLYREVFEPYSIKDYRGIFGEMKKNFGNKEPPRLV